MRRGVLLALAGCLTATPAFAGVEDTIGLGPRAMALAGSYSARPGTHSATYYNPAGLAPPGEQGRGGFFDVSLAYVYARPRLHVTGLDGSELVAAPVPSTKGVIIGTRFSVGQPFDIDGLNMGLSVYVPNRLFRWHILPDEDLQWALLTDRTQVFSAHAGLAWRATEWLSVGAGLRISFDAQTLTRGEVTNVDSAIDPQTGKGVVRTNTRIGTDATVYGRVTPLAGVLITPAPDLNLALVYRHPSYVDDWGDTRITGVPGLGNLGYNHHFAHYYEPRQVTLGASGDVATGLTLSADVTYSAWSEGLSTNHNFWGEGRWGDTITPSVGVSWQAADPIELMAGYGYWRAPVKNFGGPTNLLASDRHTLSTGAGLHLGELFGVKELDASLVWALRYTLLVEETERKDFRYFESDAAFESNPGYPGYSYGGYMLSGSVGLEARF